MQNDEAPVSDPAITTVEVLALKVRLVEPDTDQLQMVVAAVPQVQVLAPRLIVRVPDPKTEKELTLTVAVSPELPRVRPPVAVAKLIVPTVQLALRVMVPVPDAESNVAVSAVELGQPPVAAHVPPVPPVPLAHLLVSLRSPVPPTQKQVAASAN